MKKFASILLAATLALTVTACGDSNSAGSTDNAASGSSNGTANKPIEITYWYSWGDKIAENNENLVKMFNESQDEVIVKAEYQGTYADQHSKAQAAFAAGNAPEVWQNEIASVGVFGESGMTQELTSFVEKDQLDMDDFIPGLMGNSYVNDKLYALPYLRSTPILYFNRTMLKEAGLDPTGPKNWAEFEDYARKLTIKDQRYGISMPVDIWIYEAFVRQSGGTMTSEDGKSAAFNNETGIEPVKLWLKMKDEGIMNIGTTDDAGTQAKTDFHNQRSAMLFSSTADLTNNMKVAEDQGFELGTTFMPANDTYGVPTGGANLVMTSGLSPEKQEAAWKFIKWMTAKEQTIYASSFTGYLPSRISAVESDEMKKVYEEKPLFKVAVDQLEYAGPRPMQKVYPEIGEMIKNEILRAVVDSSVSAEAAVAEAAKKANALLSK